MGMRSFSFRTRPCDRRGSRLLLALTHARRVAYYRPHAARTRHPESAHDDRCVGGLWRGTPRCRRAGPQAPRFQRRVGQYRRRAYPQQRRQAHPPAPVNSLRATLRLSGPRTLGPRQRGGIHPHGHPPARRRGRRRGDPPGAAHRPQDVGQSDQHSRRRLSVLPRHLPHRRFSQSTDQ